MYRVKKKKTDKTTNEKERILDNVRDTFRAQTFSTFFDHSLILRGFVNNDSRERIVRAIV